MVKTIEDLEKVSLKDHWFDFNMANQEIYEQVKVLAVYPTMIKIIDKEGEERFLMIKHIVSFTIYDVESEKEFEKELKEYLEEE